MMSLEVDLDGLFRSNKSYDYDNYESNDDLEPRDSFAVLVPVLYSAVLVIGLLGNGLVLTVVVLKRRSWSISNTFVLHLSVADVLLLLTLPFWAAQAALRCGWCFTEVLCKISGGVFNVNFYCGILLLLCISLDRFLSVCHATMLFSPDRHRLAHISCLLVWLFSLILATPDWIFRVALKDLDQERTLCVHAYSGSTTDWQLLSRLLHHILGFLLPTAAIITCLTCILLQLQGSRGLRKQKAIMVILSMVVVFFICWMPYNITLIVDTIRSSSKKHDDLSEKSLKTALKVTSMFGCISACLRPLLYFGLCANFRTQIRAMLECASIESVSSLWDFGIGKDEQAEQNHNGEVQEQLTSVDHQVQSTQC